MTNRITHRDSYYSLYLDRWSCFFVVRRCLSTSSLKKPIITQCRAREKHCNQEILVSVCLWSVLFGDSLVLCPIWVVGRNAPLIQFWFIYIICFVPSVLWRCWLGGRKGIRPVKNWVVGCWRGYLSGARCRLAYGPADGTATHCLLL